MYRAFYATRSQAERWGYTLKKKATITREEAKKIRDYYKRLETGQGNSISTIVGLLTGSIKGILVGIGVTAVSNNLSFLFDYIEDLDNKFDMLATSKDNISFVEYTFKYREHGSGGGAYFLDDVKLI